MWMMGSGLDVDERGLDAQDVAEAAISPGARSREARTMRKAESEAKSTHRWAGLTLGCMNGPPFPCSDLTKLEP